MNTTGSMTKAELVEEVSRVSDLTKKHSEVIVDTVFKSIIDALHRGEKIELRGFGSFRLRRREPRKGRNPKTGDKVDVPPKKVPYFKPGKELKELINREPDDAGAVGSPALAGRRRTPQACDRSMRLYTPLAARLRHRRRQVEPTACSARRSPSADADPLDRLSRRDLLRHPQPLPLQQRPPDGGPEPPHRDAGRRDARTSCAS